MPNPSAAMLVVGDEILSGRTRDSNMHHLAMTLVEAGIDLVEVRIVPDEPDAIINAVRALSESCDHVFTSGGIGPTHDDITAENVARAFDLPIAIRGDAYGILETHYAAAGLDFNEARKRMARIPDGARLIENPVSAAPGFTIRNVHVMAGVPTVFKAMLANVLPGLAGGEKVLSETLRLECGEGDIACQLGKLAEKYPDLSFGSYPFRENGCYGTNIVVRGKSADQVEGAIDDLKTVVMN
ncbi:MAG: molybdopterin-binding protein [Roseovarius sp.]|nr:molybdopterin-binding protein [Roseovarius sp.]MCY4314916.1 molybdopterin-binding protein [Roseovarius sp.]